MIVDCAVYEDGRRRNGEVELDHAYEACRESGKFAWIGLYEPTEREFDSLQREFVLHPLAVEDAIHAHQRPKLDVYEGLVFIVLKTARYVDEREVVEFGEILIFLGHDFLLTVRHGEASASAGRAQASRGQPGSAQARPRAVLHAIVDRVVDDYLALTGLGEDIEEVENEVFSDSRTTRRSASTSSSGRCSTSTGPPRRWWSRSIAWPRATTTKCTPRCGPTSAT